MPHAPAPLFCDPVYNGAADPTIIFNHREKTWWILYTNRRALIDTPGVAWVHGTDIGIASSANGGASWKYRGICNFEAFEPGRNTYWAPEVIFHDGLYHMYVSYITGIPFDWNDRRDIIHFTSDDLWNWKYRSHLKLSSDRVIDACVFKMPTGQWRMWYKDERHGSHSYAADSDNLFDWRIVGPSITDVHHEGPNVFALKGSYWMITDQWKGLGVYRSFDCQNWTAQERILERPGSRLLDGAMGQHADVLVVNDQAYVFYFVHPAGPGKALPPYNITPVAHRQTVLQAAKLDVVDDKLVCDRDEAFEFNLPV